MDVKSLKLAVQKLGMKWESETAARNTLGKLVYEQTVAANMLFDLENPELTDTDNCRGTLLRTLNAEPYDVGKRVRLKIAGTRPSYHFYTAKVVEKLQAKQIAVPCAIDLTGCQNVCPAAIDYAVEQLRGARTFGTWWWQRGGAGEEGRGSVPDMKGTSVSSAGLVALLAENTSVTFDELRDKADLDVLDDAVLQQHMKNHKSGVPDMKDTSVSSAGLVALLAENTSVTFDELRDKADLDVLGDAVLNWKWGEQDNSGSGTIVSLQGTNGNGWLKVQWNGGCCDTNEYRYADGAYDLAVADSESEYADGAYDLAVADSESESSDDSENEEDHMPYRIEGQGGFWYKESQVRKVLPPCVEKGTTVSLSPQYNRFISSKVHRIMDSSPVAPGAEERKQRWPNLLPALCGILLLPIPLSVAPVAMPLGRAYETGGAPPLMPLVRENWAYFFWYNTVGWSFLWFTINSWCSKLLKIELPLRTTLLPTAFCVGFYLALAAVVFPVPMGTYVGGAPCFVVLFGCIYGELPRDADRRLAARVFAFFLFWVSLLFAQSLLTALAFRNEGNAALQLVLGSAFLLVPQLAEKCFNQLIGQDMQRVDATLGRLWWLWISASLETFFNFIFCDPNEPLWWAVGVKVASEAAAGWQLIAIVRSVRRQRSGVVPSPGSEARNRRLRGASHAEGAREFMLSTLGLGGVQAGEEVEQLESAMLDAVVAVASPLHFGALLAWDHFSFNHGTFFLLDRLSTADVLHMLRLLAVSAGFSACTAGAKVFFARKHLDEAKLERLELFVRTVRSRHYMDVVLLLASVTTVAGVCMVMKHDGMDSSFKFEWLYA
eukprot:g1428.t1